MKGANYHPKKTSVGPLTTKEPEPRHWPSHRRGSTLTLGGNTKTPGGHAHVQWHSHVRRNKHNRQSLKLEGPAGGPHHQKATQTAIQTQERQRREGGKCLPFLEDTEEQKFPLSGDITRGREVDKGIKRGSDEESEGMA